MPSGVGSFCKRRYHFITASKYRHMLSHATMFTETAPAMLSSQACVNNLMPARATACHGKAQCIIVEDMVSDKEVTIADRKRSHHGQHCREKSRQRQSCDCSSPAPAAAGPGCPLGWAFRLAATPLPAERVLAVPLPRLGPAQQMPCFTQHSITALLPKT